MVIHHTLLAKSTDSTWPAISLAIGSSKSQISTIHHNLQSSHIITFHCQSVPVAIAREKTLKSGSMSKKGYYGSIPSTICGGRNVMNECWVKTKVYQLFTMFTKCWVNVGEITKMLLFFLHPKGTRKDQINWHWNIHMVSSMMVFEKWNGSWYVLENSGRQYIYWDISYLFHIKLSICWWGYIISILYKTINFVWYGYGSIPINTIFRGMNIHFNPAILMWTTGVQGFDTLPYWDISILYKTIYMLMGNMVIYNIL